MKKEMEKIRNAGEAYVAPCMQAVPFVVESALLTVSGSNNDPVHEKDPITDPDDGTDPLAG